MEERLFRDIAAGKLLFPKEYAFKEFQDSCTMPEYLKTCENNILAEYWEFIQSSTHKYPGWMRQKLDRMSVDVICENKLTNVFDKNNTRVEIDELVSNLAVYMGKLCIIGRGDKLIFGEEMCRLGKGDATYREDPNELFIIGYIRTYVEELVSVWGKQSPLIHSIVDTSRRKRYAYAIPQASLGASRIPYNKKQSDVIMDLKYDVEGIQGPPGTGKSTTIYHIIQNVRPSDVSCLVSCVQNKAVDSIAEKLASGDLPFIVVGNEDSLYTKAKEYTLKNQAERDTVVTYIKKSVTRFEGMRDLFESKMGGKHLTGQWKRWWTAYVKMKHPALVYGLDFWGDAVITQTNVLMSYIENVKLRLVCNSIAVLCTVDTVATLRRLREFKGKNLQMVILDEAGTMPEHKVPLLLSKGARCIVAIGDQQQLEPFTRANERLQGFFQRLARTTKTPMLTTQYRMHPDICAFVSKSFYYDKLVTDKGTAASRLERHGITWMDYNDRDAEESGKKVVTSKVNKLEVDIIKNIIKKLDPKTSVMIITFYKEQMFLLQKACEGPKNVRVVTVDAAQGSEADTVILSCVRSNRTRSIGFLGNMNRMCVAVSRARERLIVVGDSMTLKRNKMWAGLLARANLIIEGV